MTQFGRAPIKKRAMCHHSQTRSVFGRFVFFSLVNMSMFRKTPKIDRWNPVKSRYLGVIQVIQSPKISSLRFGDDHHPSLGPLVCPPDPPHPGRYSIPETHCTCWLTLRAWSRWGLLPGNVWGDSNGPASYTFRTQNAYVMCNECMIM